MLGPSLQLFVDIGECQAKVKAAGDKYEGRRPIFFEEMLNLRIYVRNEQVLSFFGGFTVSASPTHELAVVNNR